MPLLIMAAAAAFFVWMLAQRRIMPGPKVDRLGFARRFREAAASVDLKGIPVDMALAVSALETGYGTGGVFLNTNNLFSITAHGGYSGQTFKASTGFVFRVYPDLSAAIADFVRLISTAPRYTTAYQLARKRDFKGFFGALKTAGYAGSDAAYDSKLVKVYGDVQGLA